MGKKKCAFVLPYFGKFNNYFPLYLRSCGCNEDYDWLIFTDDRTSYAFPSNVHVCYMSFAEMQELVRLKIPLTVSLEKPYKLCDYKVTYGLLFEEYLTGYPFWGYCDCDLIFGNLNHFITERMLLDYDQLFKLGHLSLFRNEERINRLFMEKLGDMVPWKEILRHSEYKSFDEIIFPKILDEHGIRQYDYDASANPSVYYYRFRLVKRDYRFQRYLTEDYIPAVYVWEEGMLKRYYYCNDEGDFKETEFMYMHLQQRNMKIMEDISPVGGAFQIMPNLFCPINVEGIFQNFQCTKKYAVSPDGMKRCFANRMRYRVKEALNHIFRGRFIHAKL